MIILIFNLYYHLTRNSSLIMCAILPFNILQIEYLGKLSNNNNNQTNHNYNELLNIVLINLHLQRPISHFTSIFIYEDIVTCILGLHNQYKYENTHLDAQSHYKSSYTSWVRCYFGEPSSCLHRSCHMYRSDLCPYRPTTTYVLHIKEVILLFHIYGLIMQSVEL